MPASSVLEALPQALAILRADGTVELVNRAWKRLLGEAADEPVVGRRYRALFRHAKFAKSGKQQLLDGISAVLQKKAAEFAVQLPTLLCGGERWFEFTAVHLPDDADHRVILSVFDTTAEKVSKAALRESENKIRAVLAAVPDMMFLLDRRGTFKEFYARDDRDLALPTERFIGRNISDVLPAALAKETKLRIAATLKRQEVQELDYQLAVPLGSDNLQDFEARYVPYDDQRVLAIVRNITEQKRMSDSLRASEARYRLIVETTTEGIWIIDQSNRTTFVNQTMADMLQYSREEMIGKSLYNFMDAECRKIARRNVKRRKAGTREVHDFQLQRKDGSRLWVLMATSPWFGSKGEYQGALGMVTDITERHMATEALRASELLKTIMLESALDGMIGVDWNGRVRVWNPAAQRVFGLPADVALGQDVFKLIFPEGRRQRLRRLFRRYVKVRNGRAVGRRLEISARRADGTSIPVEFSLSLTRRGDQIVMTGFVRDHTERHAAREAGRQAAEALRQSEKRYRTFFEEDLTGDFLATAEGEIVECNPAFARMFGYCGTEEAVKAAAEGEFRHMLLTNRIIPLLRERRKLEYYEVEVTGRNGQPLFLIANFYGRFDQRGRLTAVIGYLFDVTRRRQLEEQIRQLLKMEALGRLAGGIAHDFNNILAVIRGYSDVLVKQLANDGMLRNNVEMIIKAADKAATLILQLMAFSRKQGLKPQAQDLHQILQDMRQLLQRLVGDSVELTIKLHEKDMWIKASPGHIEQIIMNLAVNAHDAMPAGGRLTLQTREIELDAESALARFGETSAGKFVRLQVKDTGLGMDAATLNHIFEPFFTTKAQGKGTGFGLATVYGIVKQNHGHITVRSRPGKGTEFDIYLPRITRPAGREDADEMETKSRRKQVTILLVEDDMDIGNIVERHLTTHGYRVIRAGHPSEALQRFEENPQEFQLLLTDIVLPEINGTDLCQRLRAVQPKLKVVFMSGHSCEHIVEENLLDSATEFIAKPFNLKHLLNTVDQVLGDSPRRMKNSPDWT